MGENKSSIAMTLLGGRLGNILFELAAGMTYAYRTGKEFKIVHNFRRAPFQAYPFFYSCVEDMLYNPPEDLKFSGYANAFTKKERIPDIEGNVLLRGFFQDEMYINPEIVRPVFKMNEAKRARLLAKYPGIEDGVGISIRRGDYLRIRQVYNVYTPRYYRDAYDQYFKGLKCFVTSTNPKWVRRRIRIDNMTVLDGSDEECLLALSLCRHHIISNSTFGWWSSYLNEQIDSINIAPSSWYNKDCVFKDVCPVPSRWKKIEIDEKYLAKQKIRK